MSDGNFYAKQQEKAGGKKGWIPMDRGPTDDKYTGGKGPGRVDKKSAKELELGDIVLNLKQTLQKSQEKNISLAGVVRRMEKEMNKCIKDNAALLSWGGEMRPKELARIHRDNEKSEIVRKLRGKVSELEQVRRAKDGRSEGQEERSNDRSLYTSITSSVTNNLLLVAPPRHRRKFPTGTCTFTAS